MNRDDARSDAVDGAAPGGEGEALAAVRSLMAERRRFEGWLAALDARRESTPEHVFARVNGDYQRRLDAVLEQLTSHTDLLRREVDALSQRLVLLRDEQQRAQDERAEAELRAHVGELSGDEWQSTASSSDTRLAELARRQEEVEGEIARTRELLEATQRPPTPAAAAPAQVSDVAEAAMHVPSADVAVPAAAPREHAMPAHSPADHAEHHPPAPHAAEMQPAHHAMLADVQPSGGQAPADATHGGQAAQQPSSAGDPAARRGNFDELAFLSSVVDTPTGSVDPAPLDEPDEITRRVTFAQRSHSEGIVKLGDSGSIPLVSRVPDQESAGLPRAPRADQMIRRDSVSDGAKTLKCGECGSMNYPTEWYCERCGAELASL